jgi:hypothetical protein
MNWYLSDRGNARAAQIADRHYNRQNIGSPQFVPPGRCLVLLTEQADALWVTSWPFAEYVKHAWAGAWMCSCYRNESTHLSSELITEAVAATRWFYGNPPPLGFVTFVNTSKIKSVNPGYCYKMAGWIHVGHTQGGLVALQLKPQDMTSAAPPNGAQLSLDWEVAS